MMAVTRQEHKYYINPMQYTYIINGLNSLMTKDIYCSENQDYHVRSLYFDTLSNKDYEDKISGIENRKKIRLRLYHTSDTKIKAEIKNKFSDYIHKETVFINRQQVMNLLNKEFDFLLKKDPLFIKLYMHFKQYSLEPVAIIDYEREAYTLPFNNIRVTIDKNVRINHHYDHLFRDDLDFVPITDSNTYILEVKFNHFLPKIIGHFLASCTLHKTSISKYCIARRIK